MSRNPIEVMAATYCKAARGWNWANMQETFRESATQSTAAVIAALDAAGYAIVPKAPTAEMVDRSVIKIHHENKGIEYAPAQVWEAMVAIGAVKP